MYLSLHTLLTFPGTEKTLQEVEFYFLGQLYSIFNLVISDCDMPGFA
ncbi:unnamed protein product [Larinioides sclopetarius]|uniref:Uncharacterized protein n=1 Tax=Larinioides sclopetarius TaxID=280406 RepID=A0AAV1Z6G0_9ARAC